jgi:hypothetical protein
MKTSILTLALALAFSFTATPANAKVSAKQKCDAGKQTATAKHLQCRTLAEAKNTKKPDVTKRSAALAKCDTKLSDMFAKFEGKAPEDSMAADEDQCSNYEDYTNVLELNVTISDAVATGLPSTSPHAVFSVAFVQSLSDAASNNQGICETAGGTWASGACTPAAVPDRECFREGACGVDGWDHPQGVFAGVTISSTGCSDTTAGTESYNGGVFYSSVIDVYLSFDARFTTIVEMCE